MASVMIRNRAMYYQDVGKGLPVLLCHPLLLNRRVWQSLVEVLSPQYRCIVPDLWSHGYSEEVPQKPYSIEQMAEDLYALMKSLNCTEYAVVGASLGGLCAAQLAINHPKQVKALALVGCFLGQESLQKKAAYQAVYDVADAANGFSADLVELIASYYFYDYSPVNPLATQFKIDLQSTPHERLDGLFELGLTIMSRQSFYDQLSELRMPTLVLCGECDLICTPEESQEMVSLLPDARFKRIENAAHVSYLEQPKDFNQFVNAFFAESLTN